jgi:hypothetical protein
VFGPPEFFRFITDAMDRGEYGPLVAAGCVVVLILCVAVLVVLVA